MICFDYCAKETHGHFPAPVGPAQILHFRLQPYYSHLGQFSVPQKRHILSTWDLQAVSSSDGHILLPKGPSPPSPGSFTQCSLTCWLEHHFPGKVFSPDKGEQHQLLPFHVSYHTCNYRFAFSHPFKTMSLYLSCFPLYRWCQEQDKVQNRCSINICQISAQVIESHLSGRLGF